MSKNYLHDAEDLIRQSEGRVTAARVRVLAFLLEQEEAITHHQIEEAFDAQQKMDRVTLYRVLDWLTQQGFTHKIMSGDRVWRFHVNDRDRDMGEHAHAHFKCGRCAKVTCLPEVTLDYKLSLPKGYRAQGIELTVTGSCSSCSKTK